MLTDQDVDVAYRLVLNRTPEDEAIVQSHVAHSSGHEALFVSLLGSVEFLQRVKNDSGLQQALTPALVALAARRR